MAKAKTALVIEESLSKPALTQGMVDSFKRGISGYHGCSQEIAHDDTRTNLACDLNCTVAGYAGVYRIKTPEDALAIRVAARQRTAYATYVICNLGYGLDKKSKSKAQGYGGSDQLAYDCMIAAGWQLIAEMPGAHGSYVSLLMGATTAPSVEDLLKMREKELTPKREK